MDNIDVIGDVHGHADALEALLDELGYDRADGVWRHRDRHALFLGDLIDRGPRQLDAVAIPRRMSEAGAATVMMGNHEFNAIAYLAGTRPRDGRNRSQHAAFLDAVGEDSALHRDLVGWFAGLPLWLDRPRLGLVHACWDLDAMDLLAPLRAAGGGLTRAGLARAIRPGTAENVAAESLLKGPEADLPPGVSYRDAHGLARTRTRVSWWGGDGFRETALVEPETRAEIPDLPLPAGARVRTDPGKAVLFGHYWMQGDPSLLAPSRGCLDWSVAKGGRLAAYRYDGEAALDPGKIVSVAADACLDLADAGPRP